MIIVVSCYLSMHHIFGDIIDQTCFVDVWFVDTNLHVYYGFSAATLGIPFEQPSSFSRDERTWVLNTAEMCEEKQNPGI